MDSKYKDIYSKLSDLFPLDLQVEGFPRKYCGLTQEIMKKGLRVSYDSFLECLTLLET